MKTLLLKLTVVFLLITGIVTNAFAVTKQAIKSGNWDDPSIWAPAGVPQATDDVYIYNTITVTVTSTVNVNSIAVYGGTLNFVGNTTVNYKNSITLADNSNVQATVNLVGSANEVHVFNGRYISLNKATWNHNGGIMRCDNPGYVEFNNAGTINLNVHGTSLINVKITNNGGITYSPPNGNVNIYKSWNTSFSGGGRLQSRPGGSITTLDTLQNDYLVEAFGNFIFNGYTYGVGNFSGNNFEVGTSGTLFPAADIGYIAPRCFTFPKSLILNGTYKNVIYNNQSYCSQYYSDGHGKLIVTDTMYLNGTLQLSVPNTPSSDGVYTIIKSRVLVGTFQNISPALPTGWSIRYNYPATGDVSLEYISCNRPTVSVSPDHTFNCSPKPVTLTATTNAANPTYTWSNGQTTRSITVNPASTTTYTVTIGSGPCAATASATVEVNPKINVSVTKTDPVCAGSATGSATANVSGDTSPYTYSWSNGATTQTINNLAAGTYHVTVYDDNFCGESASVTITDPPSITLTTSTTAATCGANNGSATVTATNGTAPYTYLWSNGATTQTVNNLSAGNYSVTVTDAKGCTKAANVTVASASTTVLTTSSTNVSCSGGNNGSATVTASSGTSPYTYLWSNGATTSTINNLSAGTYTVTVTDASGCSKTASVTITAPPVLTLTANSTNVSCSGGNNGVATVSASGGTSPYTYAWSNGATTSAINNLSAGIYNITVTDGNGCAKTASVTITAPAAIIVNTTSTNVTCNGGNTGAATASVSGGVSPYTYAWSNGAISSTINNLSAGTYTVTVTDANGCVKTGSVTITQPAAIVVNSTSTNISCNGANNGSATVTPSGGTSPYTYSWSNGTTSSTINNLSAGTYNVTVTDAAGCIKTASVTITEPAAITVNATSTNVTCGGSNNGSATVTASGGTSPYTYLWSNGATTQTINNLSAGNYTVIVTDVNGCTKSTSFTITSPTPVTLTTNSTNSTCNGGNNGSATVSATGGTSPYSYAWSNGGTTSTINNLSAGTYNVTVTDATGCAKTSTVTITSPSAITLTTSVTNVSCSGGNNGSATVTVNGGTSPYTYLWSNGATTQTINNIPAGTYTVTVADARGCTKTAIVTLTPGPALLINLGPDRTLCFGQTVTLDGTNNFPGVVYKWTGTNGFSASTPVVVVGNTGSYYLEVSTPSGCIAKDTVNINATTDPISSDFIMASQGYKDSLVNSINIALPVPDSVEWIIPGNPNISVLSKSKQKAEFKFLQLGTYSIGMKAYRGQCFSITNKQIVILQGTVFTTPARREPLIKQFNILPNPNNGQFTVKVALRENTDIRLRVIEFVTGNIINDRSLKGAKDYNEAYTLTVAPGTYSLILETAKESRTQKIVIQ